MFVRLNCTFILVSYVTSAKRSHSFTVMEKDLDNIGTVVVILMVMCAKEAREW